jgi:hypothetical protein
MARFASVLREDPWLYRVTGCLYDIDYVMSPHDLPGADPVTSHPIPITRELILMSAPPALTLAVLEHAPRLNLTPTTPLSHSLIACGDAVTFAACDIPISWPADLPKPLIEILKTAPRGGVQDPMVNLGRANRVFDSLSALAWHVF